MNLIGKTIHLYEEVEVSDNAKFEYWDGGKDGLRKVYDGNHTWESCRYYTISDKPKGYNIQKTTYLPYFAKVTEDLPAYMKKSAKVYEHCQLTTEFPNGYLVFECMKTKVRLKIAMNSHTYEPIDDVNVLICNNCKTFWIAPKEKCKCGSTTLTKTHESNIVLAENK